MSNEPIIGQWYKNPKLSGIFEVIAVDKDENLIELQYFDGQIEEIDFELWNEHLSTEIAAPEDWSGAYELSKEDLSDYKEEVIHPENWNSPLNTMEAFDSNPEDLEEEQ